MHVFIVSAHKSKGTLRVDVVKQRKREFVSDLSSGRVQYHTYNTAINNKADGLEYD